MPSNMRTPRKGETESGQYQQQIQTKKGRKVTMNIGDCYVSHTCLLYIYVL